MPPLAPEKQPLLDQLRTVGAAIVVGPQWARSKQIFEQLALPLLARSDGVACLVQLNNNVCFLRRKRQVCFVYDVAPLRIPETYRRAYRLKFRATLAGIKRRRPAVVTLSEFSRRELESVGVAVSAVVPGGLGSPMLLQASDATLEVPQLEVPQLDGPYAVVFGSADPRKPGRGRDRRLATHLRDAGTDTRGRAGGRPNPSRSRDHAITLSGCDPAERPGQRCRPGRSHSWSTAHRLRQPLRGWCAGRRRGGRIGHPVVASDIPTFRELLSPPVELFGAFDELVGAAGGSSKPKGLLHRRSFRRRRAGPGAGEAFGEVVAGASELRSAVPARREQSETVRG